MKYNICRFVKKMKFSILIAVAICAYCCGFDSDSKFAVTGIDSITGIELIENNNKITLEKSGDGTWLSSSFKANMRNVANLKKILENIEIQYPLPKMYENVYSQNKISEGVHIKVYKGNRTAKDYYLLFTDSLGTIGLVNGKTQAYIVDLPHQNIDLSDYVIVEPAFWENNFAFSIQPEEIKLVKLENLTEPDNSFIIRKNNDSIFLYDFQNKLIRHNQTKTERYLSYFGKISFENNLNISDLEKQKIISSNPLYILSIETPDAKLTCRIYPVPDAGLDDYGNPLVYSRDFFCLFIPEKELFAKAKWLEFDILLEELDYLSN